MKACSFGAALGLLLRDAIATRDVTALIRKALIRAPSAIACPVGWILNPLLKVEPPEAVSMAELQFDRGAEDDGRVGEGEAGEGPMMTA